MVIYTILFLTNKIIIIIMTDIYRAPLHTLYLRSANSGIMSIDYNGRHGT